jgi:hypothetical protein
VTSYSRQDVLRILQISSRQLQGWERAGLIPRSRPTPSRILASSAPSAHPARRAVSAASIRHSIVAMKAVAGMANPLLEACLVRTGTRLAFRHRGAMVDPIRRQLLFDFERQVAQDWPSPEPGSSSPYARRRGRNPRRRSGPLSGRRAGRGGRRKAARHRPLREILALDPAYAPAYINLGTIYFHLRQLWPRRGALPPRHRGRPGYVLAFFDLGNVLDELSARMSPSPPTAARRRARAALRRRPLQPGPGPRARGERRPPCATGRPTSASTRRPLGRPRPRTDSQAARPRKALHRLARRPLSSRPAKAPPRSHLCWLAAAAMAVASLTAQKPAPRIQSEISLSSVTPVKGALGPFAQPRFDAGRMPTDTRLTGMLINFNRTAAQQADLEALLAAQQNPASPLFHQWLTPEQFAARFGMAQADLDKVQAWLQQQGFSIDWVARSRNAIRFSGTVNQVELAFQTQMHIYKVDGEQHFAPSTPLSLPSAFAGTIESVRGISDFRLKPMHILANKGPRPEYTFYGNSTTQYVLFAPGDVKVAYDVTPLTTANITGAGQTIAVMGQSQISVTDIENFQTASGLPIKDPTLVLVPGTGSSAVSSGDQGESDLDLEWSGAMAPGANIVLVYAGNSNASNGVFDSIQFAIDEKIGDIITLSYGACELELNTFTQDSLYQQASSQGQSIIASSGDTGSTACFGYNNLTTTQQQSLAVNYPASSAYVTAVGGTEITAANDVVGPFWATAPSQSTITLTSALKYIPEVAWNDDAYDVTNGCTSSCLSSSGGGASSLYAVKPAWQASVPGIPSDSKRDLPDVSLYSSPDLPGYLYCTSDQSDWYTGHQTGSCVNGQFYDANGYFSIAGGTSFAAPIFAGMVALINQKANYVTGTGFLNPSLYTLASNSATYASAFHDVTAGSNYCLAGTATGSCSSSGATEGYPATVGYDLVTGLGSVDLNNLATAWTASTTTLIGTTTTVAAATSTPTANTADNFTISVGSNTGATVPTGSVSISVNGGTASVFPLTANGTYVDVLSFTSAGAYTVVVQYTGDASHAASTGAITVTVGGSSSGGAGTFSLAATNVTVKPGHFGNLHRHRHSFREPGLHRHRDHRPHRRQRQCQLLLHGRYRHGLYRRQCHRLAGH